MGTGTMSYCSDCRHEFEDYELFEQSDGYSVCMECEEAREAERALDGCERNGGVTIDELRADIETKH